ncbi:hypothetical protein DYB32_005485 [Aphanomyces invadans]|uniref:Peroxin-19 n=1 Tax=Aphanomyces invadans TaxID=157072 RepID=A0A3R6Z3A8_9STRA|nr:hypothetical protein DYB32_005485 [Aphanomyces invadans]
MAKAAEDMEGLDTNKAEEMGEEMMQEMMKQFEQMGEKNDFQGLVDGMMQQLLSRDVMYDPMKQICEKYPAWLAEKEPHLSKEDYERYGKQYQYFQQILAVYENEPDNYARLSELMQEVCRRLMSRLSRAVVTPELL